MPSFWRASVIGNTVVLKTTAFGFIGSNPMLSANLGENMTKKVIEYNWCVYCIKTNMFYTNPDHQMSRASARKIRRTLLESGEDNKTLKVCKVITTVEY